VLYFETITPLQKKEEWIASLRECVAQYRSKERRVGQVKQLQSVLSASLEDSEDDEEEDNNDTKEEQDQEGGEDLSSMGGLPCLAVSFPEEMMGPNPPPAVSTRRDILTRRRPSF
jgi:hypothetical protein